MSNWLIINNNKIVNVIEAESQEIAESITGMTVELDDQIRGTGWENVNNSWRPPQPDPSATWNGSEWVLPAHMQNDILLFDGTDVGEIVNPVIIEE